MSLIDDDVRVEIIDILTSSLTGLTDQDGISTVFEYEVEDGIFLGVDSQMDDDAILATLYIYIADTHPYTAAETASLEDNDTISALLQDIRDLLSEAFEGSEVDPDALPDSLEKVEPTGESPGRYYSMRVPREPTPHDTPE